MDHIAVTLLDLLFGTQQWVENFLNEINTIAEETTKTPENAQWLGTHLRAWLEADDGMEFFYEVELRVSPLMLWGMREDDREDMRNADVDLLIWKGVVNQAVLIIVYRRGSFYMVLRPVEDVAQLPLDGMEFFGFLPNLADGKGRGYLVHQFPTPSPGPRDQRWLSGAKLLLWQTGASVAREDLAAEEAQAKWHQSLQDEERTTSKWFNEDENPTTQPIVSTSASRRGQETEPAGGAPAGESGWQRT
ncbi:hypothetical protein PINS_up006677 [Pythium insidiosum]|nr:hypothetical protein PINS_up006677 [Pythium insidiosum]